jgi:hypothetical protein
VYLAEIKISEIACRARSGARATTYTGLQFGHLSDNLIALVEIVAVEVDGAWFVYGKSKINHSFLAVRFGVIIVYLANP